MTSLPSVVSMLQWYGLGVGVEPPDAIWQSGLGVRIPHTYMPNYPPVSKKVGFPSVPEGR